MRTVLVVPMPAPFPRNAEVARMPVDRLAMHVLWYLADIGKYYRRIDFIMDRIDEDGLEASRGTGVPYQRIRDGAEVHTPVGQAWGEAWEWLIVRGLVTADLQRNSDYWRISRDGRRVAREAEPLTHLHSRALLDADLHPRIAQKTRSLFAQGMYDLAAFESMKQVEVRVRELAGADAGSIGTDLMYRAFKPEGGPLADPNAEDGERKSTAALFAGAIGVFKNPTSHRQVEFEDATEASEIVRLADLLLRILDRRESELAS